MKLTTRCLLLVTASIGVMLSPPLYENMFCKLRAIDMRVYSKLASCVYVKLTAVLMFGGYNIAAIVIWSLLYRRFRSFN